MSEPLTLSDATAKALLEQLRGHSELPAFRRIFVNRTLRMDGIRCIGFDLDWTLAAYHRDALGEVTFRAALDRLVERQGYPESIRAAEFRPGFLHRGLLIDREAGTVVKMDRHRYVGQAYLGREHLADEERARLYRHRRLDLTRERFYHVDTLFELPEVNLFSELVELERRGRLELADGSYGRLFQDVRTAVDEIHADMSLKRAILADLPRFLPRDPEMALALQRLAMHGRRLLLITNSEWSYTDELCSYLFNGSLPGLGSWTELFDLVVVQAGKPVFFRRDDRPFVRLDREGRDTGEERVPAWGGLYRGGCRVALMERLDALGEEVLYVGDHIYSDIRWTRISSTWRTALIVSELEEELTQSAELLPVIQHLGVLLREIRDVGHQLDDLRDLSRLAHGLAGNGHRPLPRWEVEAAVKQIDEIAAEHRALRRRGATLSRRIREALNPTWGSIFKQGPSKSLFGEQVDNFACLYTSRVSNFLCYGSQHYFRVTEDLMPHERP
jgi:HAD superfamily 5'-nucleotidase-like hydrolase